MGATVRDERSLSSDDCERDCPTPPRSISSSHVVRKHTSAALDALDVGLGDAGVALELHFDIVGVLGRDMDQRIVGGCVKMRPLGGSTFPVLQNGNPFSSGNAATSSAASD